MLLDAPSVLDAWAFPDETAADLAQCTPHGLLLDVLATGEGEEVDAAMRFFADMLQAHLAASLIVPPDPD